MPRCLDRWSDPHPRSARPAGLLQNIDLNNRDCQALILAPTRELASQIVKVVMAIGDYLGVSTMVRATPRTPGRPAPPPRSRRRAPAGSSGGAGRGCPWAPWRGRSVSAGTAQGATATHARTHARTRPLHCTGSAAAEAAPLRPTRRSVRGAADEALARDPLPPPARQACIGGTNVRQDMDKLRSGVQLVVGTLDPSPDPGPDPDPDPNPDPGR